MEDLSIQSVVRAERLLAASWVAYSRAFHDDMEAYVRTPPLEGLTHHVGGHFYRSDATNSSVWQRAKIHNTQLRSVYLTDHNRANASDFIHAVSTHVSTADLARVVDGSGV
eukprot:1459343-Pyramimonas_sp.AAC.1